MRRRPAGDDGDKDRGVFVRLGAAAPKGVVVAKGDDDCPHTTPSDFLTAPRKSTATPFPSTEDEPPSAPVTAGDPAVAKAGVVAHGALRHSFFKGMVR